MTNEEAKVFLDNLKICIDEHPIVADWLVEIADRKTEPQTNADQHAQHVGSVESVEPTWTKEEHEAFYTFLWNVINPNEMQDYIGTFESKGEPIIEVYNGNADKENWQCITIKPIEDEPQTDVYDYKGNGKWERSE
jgi:hypothetical protein